MATTHTRRADFLVSREGLSLVLVRPRTVAARAWLQDHTDGTWFAGALVVEPRYVEPLLVGAAEEGFRSEVQ